VEMAQEVMLGFVVDVMKYIVDKVILGQHIEITLHNIGENAQHHFVILLQQA